MDAKNFFKWKLDLTSETADYLAIVKPSVKCGRKTKLRYATCGAAERQPSQG
jgi:hypothetical protein